MIILSHQSLMAFLFMKKHIPNFITCLNLFSGCVGILMLLQGDYTLAFYCVIASGLFDFLDGFSARLLQVNTVIGKDLDSLADVISFGLQPGVLMYVMLKNVVGHEYIAYLGFVITIFSALRLAKFNVDERQSSDFIGVNTPMNTFFIFSLPFIAEKYDNIVYNPYVLLIITIVSSLLLVSELRLFSMKLTTLAWKENKFKYIFLILSILLIVFMQLTAIPIIYILYLLFSYFHFSSEAKSRHIEK